MKQTIVLVLHTNTKYRLEIYKLQTCNKILEFLAQGRNAHQTNNHAITTWRSNQLEIKFQ